MDSQKPNILEQEEIYYFIKNCIESNLPIPVEWIEKYNIMHKKQTFKCVFCEIEKSDRSECLSCQNIDVCSQCCGKAGSFPCDNCNSRRFGIAKLQEFVRETKTKDLNRKVYGRQNVYEFIDTLKDEILEDLIVAISRNMPIPNLESDFFCMDKAIMLDKIRRILKNASGYYGIDSGAFPVVAEQIVEIIIERANILKDNIVCEKILKKPPLGLTPRYITSQHRYEEVCGAIRRYFNASLTIPIEWIEEHNELQQDIKWISC